MKSLTLACLFLVCLREIRAGFEPKTLYLQYINSTACPLYQCWQSQQPACSYATWPQIRLDPTKCGGDETCYINYKLDGVCVKQNTITESTALYPGQTCDPSSQTSFCAYGSQMYVSSYPLRNAYIAQVYG